MLDDLKLIHTGDSQDALGSAGRQPEYLLHDFALAPAGVEGITDIVYAGLGSSGLAAMLAKAWPGVKLPLEIVRDYDLPAYVGSGTLCIFASYSGNTEETLSALSQAEARGAHVGVITGGGELADWAKRKGYPLALLPKVKHPRFAVLANYKAILDLLQAFGVLDVTKLQPELSAAADYVAASSQEWLPEIPTAKNPAKQLAQELMGRSVVVYSGPFLAAAAYKWKIAINENAKQVAWTGQYPEASHNEFAGWSQQPVAKPYAVIDLRSSYDHDRVIKRFELTERLLSGKRPAPEVVHAQGDTRLKQLLWTLAYGDYVSIYLALLGGVNPAPLDTVDTFKKAMEE